MGEGYATRGRMAFPNYTELQKYSEITEKPSFFLSVSEAVEEPLQPARLRRKAGTVLHIVLGVRWAASLIKNKGIHWPFLLAAAKFKIRSLLKTKGHPNCRHRWFKYVGLILANGLKTITFIGKWLKLFTLGVKQWAVMYNGVPVSELPVHS